MMVSGPIALLASGTRGDVVPYLALAGGLRDAGCQVRIVTHPDFRGLAHEAGVDFVALDGNPSELLMRPAGQEALRAGAPPLRALRESARFIRAARPLYTRMLASARIACAGAALVVGGLSTLWAGEVAAAVGARMVWAFLQPVTRTRAWPSALLPAAPALGGWFNAWTHRAVERGVWWPWRGVVNQWRQAQGLAPADWSGPLARLQRAPILYAFSPAVVPVPRDWPVEHQPTGYWFGEAPAAPRVDGELERFVSDTGGRVVYVGLGSPGMRNPAATISLIVHALEAAGLAGVVGLPPQIGDAEAGRLCDGPYGSRVRLVRHVPHAWLFPRLAVVAHHGGAGTTAAAFRAGVPQVVLPDAVDQFFWGSRVAALGVGPRPVPQRGLSVAALAAALQSAAFDQAMRVRSQSLGEVIRTERGVARAVALILEGR